MPKKLKILLSPLDWGMGHTTRCIPLIKMLLQQGHSVAVAGTEESIQVFRQNIPELSEFYFLPGYRIIYSRNGRMFGLRIGLQIPKILRAISREKQWLKNMLSHTHFDLIISDNRYGFYDPKTKSVILTHQLGILSGMGTWADKILLQLHAYFLKKFHETWIVDNPEPHHLAGKLSHPDKQLLPVKHIGILTQLSVVKPTEQDYENTIVILLSGPEPQRTILSEKIWQQIISLPQFRFTFIQGSQSASTPINIPNHIDYYSFVAADQLFRIIKNADLVICRSGYSTLMDLSFLHKKALLIPTPGQTEQVYLAEHLHKQYAIPYTHQENINLSAQIPQALTANPLPHYENDISSKLKELLHHLNLG